MRHVVFFLLLLITVPAMAVAFFVAAMAHGARMGWDLWMACVTWSATNLRWTDIKK